METVSAAKILLIEDDPDGRRSVTEALEVAGWSVVAAGDGATAVALLQKEEFDAVLSDLVLPDTNGLEILEKARKLHPQLPFLLMTAYGSVETAIRAMKSGAYDYLVKPLDLDDLHTKMRRALETHALRREVGALQEVLSDRFSLRQMVSESSAMQRVIRQIKSVADTNVTVLILGESGTGKELVARGLHGESRRARGPFVAVNCGAFTETLLESALFGHEKGSFTGAVARRQGAFERAGSGTLFLDEIAIAPKSVQMRLLRAIEEKEILRVGGEEPVKVDTRILAASNREMDVLVEEGAFLPDLLFRLQVVTIRVPPLRERKEDIRPLVDRFVALASEEHGRIIDHVEPDFYEAMERHSWPGNVRELRNVVESSVIQADDRILNAQDVALALDVKTRKEPVATLLIPSGMSLSSLEKEVLLQALTRNKGNRFLTAQELGISIRTIQRKIKDYNLPF
ncbi:MAG: sigma-54 dependent transcriptional regulator [Kiritimatiellia bacterium]